MQSTGEDDRETQLQLQLQPTGEENHGTPANPRLGNLISLFTLRLHFESFFETFIPIFYFIC